MNWKIFLEFEVIRMRSHVFKTSSPSLKLIHADTLIQNKIDSNLVSVAVMR
jgi:hypothetical protein